MVRASNEASRLSLSMLALAKFVDMIAVGGRGWISPETVLAILKREEVDDQDDNRNACSKSCGKIVNQISSKLCMKLCIYACLTMSAFVALQDISISGPSTGRTKSYIANADDDKVAPSKPEAQASIGEQRVLGWPFSILGHRRPPGYRQALPAGKLQ